MNIEAIKFLIIVWVIALSIFVYIMMKKILERTREKNAQTSKELEIAIGRALKDEMIKRGLSLDFVRIVELDGMLLHLDLKNDEVFISVRYDERQDKAIIEAPVECAITPKIYRELVKHDKLNLAWEFHPSKKAWVVPFNKEHDIINVQNRSGGVWTINVTGVSREHITGFEDTDTNAVLKMSEVRLRMVMDKVDEIIERSGK